MLAGGAGGTTSLVAGNRLDDFANERIYILGDLIAAVDKRGKGIGEGGDFLGDLGALAATSGLSIAGSILIKWGSLFKGKKD